MIHSAVQGSKIYFEPFWWNHNWWWFISGPLEGTPWLFHKKRLQFHNVPISEFQNQLQKNLTCIFLVYQSEFKAENIKSFCRKPVELNDINLIKVLTSVLFITCFHKKQILNFDESCFFAKRYDSRFKSLEFVFVKACT